MRARTKVRLAAGVVVTVAVASYGNSHSGSHSGHPAAAKRATTTTAVTIGSAPVTGTSETAYIKAVLTDLHVPAPDAGTDIASIAAWVHHETPSWGQGAANNPLNSTLPEPGSTDFNTIVLASGGVIHVQNYPTATVGAAATAATIANGHYPNILGALTSGAGVCGTALGDDFATWSGTYTSVC